MFTGFGANLFDDLTWFKKSEKNLREKTYNKCQFI